MMWLLPSCLSALGTEDLSSPSSASGQMPALFVTASGKPTQRPSSWRGWQTRPWSRLLFGAATSPSFQPPHFSEWTSSPPASHASPGAVPDKVEAPRTSDGYGTTSHHFFAEWDREQSSWRTSHPSLFAEDWSSSSLTWPRSGSMRSGLVYARVMSEHPTSANGFSFWPTPNTPHGGEVMSEEDVLANGQTPRGKRQVHLQSLVKVWPTATAMDARSNGAEAYSTDSGRHLGTTLTDAAVRLWTTPKARDATNKDCPAERRRRTPNLNVESADFRQDPTTETPGPPSRPVLNPRFVGHMVDLFSTQGW